ncbi:hypothetical protein SNE40_011777 [Patella caerulea]|uniref:Pikachurin n=2 Tax=Patella caerulea TaxID=87958 RepID=A0AAN8JMK1_PATCE
MATKGREIQHVFLVLWSIVTILTVSVSSSQHPERIVAFFNGDCAVSNPCQHDCENINHQGFFCVCREGYYLNKDGKTCSVSVHEMFPEVSEEKPQRDEIYMGENNQLNSQSKHSIYESNQSKDKNSRLVNNEHRKVKNLQTDTSSEYTIHTVDLKKDVDVPPQLSELRIHEGGDSQEGSVRYVDLSMQNFPRKPVKLSVKQLCLDVVCQNNGTCVVEGNIPRCDCPLGTAGSRCQKYISVRYPQFFGMGYLALPVLKDGYKEFTIVVEFRPQAQNGLLLFSSETESAKSDFFSIALIDGYVEFRFDCGTGLGVIRSTEMVNIGQWNRVALFRIDNSATLRLNNDEPVEGTAKGEFSRITLRLNVYVGGYSNMSAISSRVGTRKRFVGCVQEVGINGYRYDLRKADIVGDAEFGVNVGECSQGICETVSCENGGICSIKSADSHVCLCPLGTSGDTCEHKHEIHIPRFSGHAYLQYEGLGRSVLTYTEIEVVFKPTTEEGLIFYNGYTKDRKGDFISLALRDSYIEFRFDLGTGPAKLRSLRPVAINQWHVVRISRTGLQGTLKVDDELEIEGESQGAYTQLTLLENLFIGGHANYDEMSKHVNISKSFTGCIQKVVINKKPLSIMEAAVDGVNVEPCKHPCDGTPCMNGGECVPQQDVYQCYCPLGYSNTNCEDRMRKLPSKPMFKGNGFLIYTDKKVVKRVTGSKIDLQMYIKPQDKNGLIFWTGQNHMKTASDFIALGFRDGSLQFRFNLGSGEAVIGYNDSRLFDGSWHFVRAQRDKQDAYLEIDGIEIVEGSSPGSYTMLNTNKMVYLGGMTDVAEKTLGKFTTGYTGCIKDITLATDFKVKLIGHAQSGRNVNQCTRRV